MAQPPRSYFTTITNFAEKVLDSVRFTRLEFNPDRTIWEIHGSINKLDIRLKEVFIRAGRMYSYYVLDQGKVVVGFDNYPDRRALEKKYGNNFTAHLSELIPHKRGPDKLSLELTDETTIERFSEHLLQSSDQ